MHHPEGTMPTTLLYARPDKEGHRVLCGRDGCGRELARIYDSFTVGDGHGDWNARLRPGEGRKVVFDAGWHLSDCGWWELTRHALERLRKRERMAAGDWSASRQIREAARACAPGERSRTGSRVPPRNWTA